MPQPGIPDKIRPMKKKSRVIAIVSLIVFWAAAGLPAFVEEGRPLIRISQKDANLLEFHFSVPADHHVTDLKHGFFFIEVDEEAPLKITSIRFPEGRPWGDEMVFQGDFKVEAFYSVLRESDRPVSVKFLVSYQICQERPLELCFPPADQEIEFLFTSLKTEPELLEIESENDSPVQGSGLVSLLDRELDKGSFLLFLLVFAAGFLTSLTPCVYPVIPIIMGYVGGRSGGSKGRGFILSLFFVLGLALVYAALGLAAAGSGAMIGASLQSPVFVVFISLVFMTMGLSMAGLFSFPVPASLSSKLSGGGKSDILKAILIGGLAALIAAPCTGPLLVVLLTWVAQSGNTLMGFLLTLTFALGLSVIFLLVGTFSGLISSLPRGGSWMSAIKNFFAVMLIGGGIYFLGTILPAAWAELAWGVFLVALAAWGGLLQASAEQENKGRLRQTLLLLLLLGGAFFFWRGLAGLTGPSASGITGQGEISRQASVNWRSDLDNALSEASSAGKPLLLDAYADWCTACKELESKTFSVQSLAELLNEAFIPVKLDFTRKNETNQGWRRDYSIIGLPTIIILAPDGTEKTRFSGFMNAADLEKLLQQVLSRLK